MGVPVVSESPIFRFHFPAPPPEPPPPILRVFYALPNNRTIRSNASTWAACWAGNLLTILTNYDHPNYLIFSGAVLTASYWAYRSFLTFDTTTLPDTAKIQSAQLIPYVYYSRCTASTIRPYWQINPGHQSDPVVIGDWYAQTDDYGVLGQIDYRDLVTGQYNPIDLNDSGLVHISKSLPTKYCMRAQLDIENFAPRLGENQARFYSEQKGAGFYPMLKVLYYPA